MKETSICCNIHPQALCELKQSNKPVCSAKQLIIQPLLFSGAYLKHDMKWLRSKTQSADSGRKQVNGKDKESKR